MTDTQIVQFVTVAKYLNFSRAADVLYISQPSLSKQIKKLEAELGFSLFERNTHDVRLTTAGETMFRYFDAALFSYAQILKKAKLQSVESSDEIFVGVLDNTSYGGLLMRLNNAVRSAGKSLRIEFHDHATLLEYLKIGYIDMAVTRCEPDDADPTWGYKELEISEDLIYVAEDSVLAGYDTVDPAVFSGHIVCVPQPGDAHSLNTVLRLGRLLSIEYEDVQTVPNLETALYMVSHRDAMIFADRHLVIPQGYKGVSTGVFHSLVLLWNQGSINPLWRRMISLI